MLLIRYVDSDDFSDKDIQMTGTSASKLEMAST